MGLVEQAGRITGLKLQQGELSYDKVIFAGDIQQVYERLLPKPNIKPKLDPKELSTSALIFHWGVKGNYPALDLHNIFFSENYAVEFKTLAAGKLPEDATIYVYVSAKHHAADAPEGHENWFVMINTPADNGQDWTKLVSQQRTLILQKLSKALGMDVAANLVSEQLTTPVNLAGRTGSAGGAIYGRASNNKFSAFLRHPNYSSRIQGLYFCGGSVHPGGGIPLCLHSARIVNDMIE
jgi:phytoene dehydrogenase-like protein